MLNLQQHCDALHEEVAHNISTGAIMRVLQLVADRHPEVTDEALTGMRAALKQALLSNAAFIESGGYHHIVVSDLEMGGTLQQENIPDEIDVPDLVLQKLEALGAPERFRKVTAYIILHSFTSAEVDRKLSAARSAADATQLLMPLLHALIEREPDIKKRVTSELSDLQAVKLAQEKGQHVLEEYCFDRKNTQPYLAFALKHQGEIPGDAMSELNKTFVEVMLRILKEYLTA